MKDARYNSGSWISKRPYKVIIAFITIWSFLFNIVGPDIQAWATAGSPELSRRAAGTSLEPARVGSNRAGGLSAPFKELNVETFALPQDLGHITQCYKINNVDFVTLDPTSVIPAKAGIHSRTLDPRLRGDDIEDGDVTVIHIQDAHCNYAAQQKISEIIKYLNREYGIDTVNLEGGKGAYDLSVFTDIYNENIREKVSDYFVKEGMVNGAEYFAVNNPDKITLWGIEDTKLYIENLNIYKDSLKHKDTIDKHLKSLSHILSNLKRHIYPAELLELDKKYSQYKSDNLELKDYLTYLIKKARQKTIDIKSFSNVYLLDQSLEQEEEIDFKMANIERDRLIDKLQKALSRNELEELVVKTVKFKEERISRKDFYEYLVKKANSINVKVDNFSELHKYIIYISLYNAIDKAKIMPEIDALEDGIKETLYQNDKQRKLNILSKNLALTKNLFNVTLTRADYEYYKKNEPSFNIRNYTRFINKNAPLYKIKAKLDNNIKALDRHREKIAEFYEYSFKRDKVFLENIRFSNLKRVTSHGRRVTALVTGGFHTENLCELFKKNNISYVSIMPNFKNGNGYKSPYFNLLAGKRNGLQEKLHPLISSAYSIQIASMLSNAIAPEAWGKANIDAFRAAVLVQKEVAKGRDIVNITRDGEDVIFRMTDGTTEQMPIRTLLSSVHQQDYPDIVKEKADVDSDFAGGLESFQRYIDMLESGSAAFSLRVDGQNAATQLGFNKSFTDLYDEFLEKVRTALAEKGSLDIDEVIAIGRSIIRNKETLSVAEQISTKGLPLKAKPVQREQIKRLLKKDLSELIAMVHIGKVPSRVDQQVELVLQKAHSLSSVLHHYLQQILQTSNLKTISFLTSQLNERFLSKPEIGFYLEASLYNNKILMIPYEIVARKSYTRPDSGETEVLYLHQIALNVEPLRKGHNAHGEKFVCISRDATKETTEDIIRVKEKGRYYATSGRTYLKGIEYLAREVIEREFGSTNQALIQKIVDLQVELHELKHNEFDVSGISDRLKQYADGSRINEALADLTSLALGPATYFKLLELLEGVATRKSRYYPSEIIFNGLSEELSLNITCKDHKSAIKIFKKLLKINRNAIKQAAIRVHEKLAKKINAGPIDEGVVKLAVQGANKLLFTATRIPPVGGGMSAEQLIAFAQNPETTSEQLVKYLSDGLWHQADVVREALKANQEKLREFEDVVENKRLAMEAEEAFGMLSPSANAAIEAMKVIQTEALTDETYEKAIIVLEDASINSPEIFKTEQYKVLLKNMAKLNLPEKAFKRLIEAMVKILSTIYSVASAGDRFYLLSGTVEALVACLQNPNLDKSLYEKASSTLKDLNVNDPYFVKIKRHAAINVLEANAPLRSFVISNPELAFTIIRDMLTIVEQTSILNVNRDYPWGSEYQRERTMALWMYPNNYPFIDDQNLRGLLALNPALAQRVMRYAGPVIRQDALNKNINFILAPENLKNIIAQIKNTNVDGNKGVFNTAVTALIALKALLADKIHHNVVDKDYLESQIRQYAYVESENYGLPKIDCKLDLFKKPMAERLNAKETGHTLLWRLFKALGITMKPTDNDDIEFELELPASKSYGVISDLLYCLTESGLLNRERYLAEVRLTFEGKFDNEAKYIALALFASSFHNTMAKIDRAENILTGRKPKTSRGRYGHKTIVEEGSTSYLGLMLPYHDAGEGDPISHLSNGQIMTGGPITLPSGEKILPDGGIENLIRNTQLLNAALSAYLKVKVYGRTASDETERRLAKVYKSFIENIKEAAAGFDSTKDILNIAWVADNKMYNHEVWKGLKPRLEDLEGAKIHAIGLQSAFFDVFNQAAEEILREIKPWDIPPVGGGLSAQQLIAFAQKPDTTPEQLVKYLSDGLWHQVDVVRAALKENPKKLGEFEQLLAQPQIEAAKDVIADLQQGTTDIIVIPGSDIYKSQQTAIEKSTERKLRRKYGQDTVPLRYAYGQDWKQNLKQVMQDALGELQAKITEGDKTARALIYAPHDSRNFIEGILNKGEFKDYKEKFTVIGEENIPDNGIIDEVMHIILAKGLLNYERFRKGDYGKAQLGQEAKIRLAAFLKTLVNNPEAIDFGKDPDIINKILEGLLAIRIQPIDFTDIRDWKKSQDKVLQAL